MDHEILGGLSLDDLRSYRNTLHLYKKLYLILDELGVPEKHKKEITYDIENLDQRIGRKVRRGEDSLIDDFYYARNNMATSVLNAIENHPSGGLGLALDAYRGIVSNDIGSIDRLHKAVREFRQP